MIIPKKYSNDNNIKNIINDNNLNKYAPEEDSLLSELDFGEMKSHQSFI